MSDSGAQVREMGLEEWKKEHDRVAESQLCDRMKSHTNMTVHQRHCKEWDPGARSSC